MKQIESTFDNYLAAGVESGYRILDFTHVFGRGEMCPMSIGGVRVYRDSNHMSGTFSFLLDIHLAKELTF